jgi:phosphoribosylformylglycinamidine synthase
VVGAVGLVPDVRRVPRGWSAEDVIFVAGDGVVSLAGSEYQASFGGVGGRPPPLDIAAEARLVSFLWRAAPLCSLVHDASEGGLAVCLAEAALFSGCGATLDLGGEPVELFGEVGGRAVLACPSDVEDELRALASDLVVPLRTIGAAGGDTLLGVELDRLRSAWEPSG